MKVAAVKKPGGLDKLVIEDRPDPKPGPGEVLVRVRASSLNYHDFVVVLGGIPTPDGRIPMSDGACEVVAVGAGVTKWKVGDKVLSLFFPSWQSGQIEAAGFQSVPGDGADGFAAELVAAPETAFTRMPDGWSFEEAATHEHDLSYARNNCRLLDHCHCNVGHWAERTDGDFAGLVRHYRLDDEVYPVCLTERLHRFRQVASV